MLPTVNSMAPNVEFFPLKMVYETIAVREGDFTRSPHQPPFEVNYFQLQPGDATPKDRHEDVEIWIVLSGEGRLIYDEQEVILKANDAVHFMPMKFHQVFNVGAGPLLICSLAWIEK